jgi:hypothetical protein
MNTKYWLNAEGEIVPMRLIGDVVDEFLLIPVGNEPGNLDGRVFAHKSSNRLFDTWQEAHQSLLAEAERELRGAREKLEKIRSMKPVEEVKAYVK